LILLKDFVASRCHGPIERGIPRPGQVDHFRKSAGEFHPPHTGPLRIWHHAAHDAAVAVQAPLGPVPLPLKWIDAAHDLSRSGLSRSFQTFLRCWATCPVGENPSSPSLRSRSGRATFAGCRLADVSFLVGLAVMVIFLSGIKKPARGGPVRFAVSFVGFISSRVSPRRRMSRNTHCLATSETLIIPALASAYIALTRTSGTLN
jgi:hypothetical protein